MLSRNRLNGKRRGKKIAVNLVLIQEQLRSQKERQKCMGLQLKNEQLVFVTSEFAPGISIIFN